jgi:hypothetical protein
MRYPFELLNLFVKYAARIHYIVLPIQTTNSEKIIQTMQKITPLSRQHIFLSAALYGTIAVGGIVIQDREKGNRSMLDVTPEILYNSIIST